jgi:hypothetical protein
MNRTLLGILALACFVGGVVMLLAGRGGEVAGALIKVGSVLGALWLALPSITGILSRTPKWVLTAAVIGIIVCVVRPQLLLIVVPLLLGLWFLSSRFLSSPADPTILGRRQRRKRDDTKGESQ